MNNCQHLVFFLSDTLACVYVVLALRAGLEVEWAAVEKPLRKAVKKYVQNDSQDNKDDQEANEVLIAEDDSIER